MGLGRHDVTTSQIWKDELLSSFSPFDFVASSSCEEKKMSQPAPQMIRGIVKQVRLYSVSGKASRKKNKLQRYSDALRFLNKKYSVPVIRKSVIVTVF